MKPANSPIVQAPNGHAYQFVVAPGLSWDAARAAAEKRFWKSWGHPGYLATIDDATEYQFIMDRLFSHGYPDVTYLGGRQTAPGEWRWVTGPDGAAEGGKGTLFWTGDEQGAAQGGDANWIDPPPSSMAANGTAAKVCCVSLFSVWQRLQFSTSLGNGDSQGWS